MSHQQIKSYCEEALMIAEQEGIHEGLAFLIGEKFSRNLNDLNKVRDKLKFLYPEKPMSENFPDSFDEESFRISYALTVNSNYRELLEKIDHLEKFQKLFIREIRSTFDLEDIILYLASHPRLGFKQKSFIMEDTGMEEKLPFSAEELLSEAEDIFLVEKMKKIFR